MLARVLVGLLPESAGGARPPSADVAQRGATSGSAQRGRRLRAAVGAGPRAVVGADDRRGGADARHGGAARRASAASRSRPRSSPRTTRLTAVALPSGPRRSRPSTTAWYASIRPSAPWSVGRRPSQRQRGEAAGLARSRHRSTPTPPNPTSPTGRLRAHLLATARRAAPRPARPMQRRSDSARIRRCATISSKGARPLPLARRRCASPRELPSRRKARLACRSSPRRAPRRRRW